jgi:hypothetical protein
VLVIGVVVVRMTATFGIALVVIFPRPFSLGCISGVLFGLGDGPLTAALKFFELAEGARHGLRDKGFQAVLQPEHSKHPDKVLELRGSPRLQPEDGVSVDTSLGRKVCLGQVSVEPKATEAFAQPLEDRFVGQMGGVTH